MRNKLFKLTNSGRTSIVCCITDSSIVSVLKYEALKKLDSQQTERILSESVVVDDILIRFLTFQFFLQRCHSLFLISSLIFIRDGVGSDHHFFTYLHVLCLSVCLYEGMR